MSFFSGRVLAALIFIITLSGFTLGFFHWNSDHYHCLNGKYWTSDRWYTVYALGRLEFRYRNLNWDCAEKYDPTGFHRYP